MNLLFTPFVGFETLFAFGALARRDDDLVLSVLSMSDYQRNDGSFVSIDSQKEDLAYLKSFYRIRSEVTFWGRESLSISQADMDFELKETIKFHKPRVIFYPACFSTFPSRIKPFKNDLVYTVTGAPSIIRYNATNTANMDTEFDPSMVSLKSKVIKSLHSLSTPDVYIYFNSLISNLGDKPYKERYFIDKLVFSLP